MQTKERITYLLYATRADRKWTRGMCQVRKKLQLSCEGQTSLSLSEAFVAAGSLKDAQTATAIFGRLSLLPST